MDVRKLLLPVLFALAGVLSATAGMAFLTAWAFLVLGSAMGQGPAALLIGFGYVLLSVGLVFLARRLLSEPAQDDLSNRPPAACTKEAGDAVSQIAFASAFVLARYLGENKRDGEGS
jgi:high-affinity Fe2+/Pb2+ permease